MKSTSILYFTNLYPLPWEPTRAAYNYQIVGALRQHANVEVLTPVPAPLWFRQWRKGALKDQETTTFPFFYLPGFGRRTYAATMLLSMLLCIYPFIKLARAKHVVASWAFPEGVVAAWCKKWFGSKVVIHCVGTDINHHFQHGARQKQMLKAFRQADRVVTVSKDLAQKIHQHALADTQIDVVYNGVSFDAFTLNLAPKPKAPFLFIGNLIKTKGIFELAEAMALLTPSYPDIHLSIVGKGPESDTLRAKVAAMGLSANVTFHGAVLHKDIPALLADAKALVLPSYREGVPNVIMEALAAGIPAVATAVGGIPEIIQDGENGVLIQSLSPQDVANSMERALNTTWQPNALRASITMYTWENCAQGFLNALKLNA